MSGCLTTWFPGAKATAIVSFFHKSFVLEKGTELITVNTFLLPFCDCNKITPTIGRIHGYQAGIARLYLFDNWS